MALGDVYEKLPAGGWTKVANIAGPAAPYLAPPLVTALPASPVDGQEVYFQTAAMAGTGAVWHLRYRAASSSAYKWEFLGGSPYRAIDVAAVNATPVNAWSAYVPSVPAPLAGEYRVGVSGFWQVGSTPGICYTWVSFNGSGPVNIYNPLPFNSWAAGQPGQLYGEVQGTITAAGQAIAWMFYVTQGGMNTQHRSLSIWPIRVG